MKHLLTCMFIATCLISYSQERQKFEEIKPLPSRKEVCEQNGDQFLKLEKYNDAVIEFTKAINLDNKDIKLYLKRGLALMSGKRYIEAIKDYTFCIDNVASLMMAKQDKDTDLHQMFQDNLKYKSVAYSRRGTTKGLLMDVRGAIEDFDSAIAIDSDNAELYVLRGLSKIQVGSKYSGCLDLSKAGEMGYSKAYDHIKKYCQ